MSQIVLTDAKIWVGGYNISGYSNEATITQTPAMLEATVFGNSTKVNKAGLYDFKADVGGFMDFVYPMGAAGSTDQLNSMNSALFSKVGGAVDVLSMAPLGNAEEDLVYFLQNVMSKFDPMGGAVGALMPYKAEFTAAGTRLVRGSLKGRGAKTATGNSAAPTQFVGGVPSGSKLFAALHVFGSSGTTPTLDVVVRSAALVDMASPTTRITFPQFTTSVGASWQSVAGAITDEFFDVEWTITGTTPSFNLAVVIGLI